MRRLQIVCVVSSVSRCPALSCCKVDRVRSTAKQKADATLAPELVLLLLLLLLLVRFGLASESDADVHEKRQSARISLAVGESRVRIESDRYSPRSPVRMSRFNA